MSNDPYADLTPMLNEGVLTFPPVWLAEHGGVPGSKPEGAPQGGGASFVRPWTACRTTSPEHPRAQGTPQGRDIRVSFFWLLFLDKQEK
jgi:hypothetical protein